MYKCSNCETILKTTNLFVIPRVNCSWIWPKFEFVAKMLFYLVV